MNILFLCVENSCSCLNGCQIVQTKKLIEWNFEDCKNQPIEKVKHLIKEIET